MMKNLIYAQSGGATAVINVTARALIEEAKKHSDKIGKIYAANGGITGILKERIYDLTDAKNEDIRSIENEPGAFFGTCRYKLDDPAKNDRQYQRLLEIFKQYNIGYFFYNGGNDSQDTSNRIAKWCRSKNLEVQCIGIPKTIDNDLEGTDSCPGFGSIAKYMAIATTEVSADLMSICGSSTKIFILEAMGRDSGWITASAGLVKKHPDDSPQILLLPERQFVAAEFLAKVKHYVEKLGYCIIFASEGIRNENNEYITASRAVVDSFGHHQLGGVAPILAEMIRQELGYKYHWAVPDYLQRAAKHIVSETDYIQAQAVGIAAVRAAMNGESEIMVGIKRISDSPYKWEIESVTLSEIANRIKQLPLSYLSQDGFSLSDEGIAYYLPLIQGEKYPQYENGVLKKATLAKKEVETILPPFKI